MEQSIRKNYEVYDQASFFITRERNKVDIRRVEKLLAQIYSPGPSYQFILDFPTFTFDFVSESVRDILGEDPAGFSPQQVFERIHPRDRGHYVRCEKIAIDFLFNRIDRSDIPFYKISFQYRMKRKSGYKLFLHQVMGIELDKNGNLSKTFGNHSDIDHITKINNKKISIIGLNGKPSFFDIGNKSDLTDNKSESIRYTNREKEILRLISEGFSTAQIANHLNISNGTVRTHRKNILSKSERNNTVEIVSLAIREGII